MFPENPKLIQRSIDPKIPNWGWLSEQLVHVQVTAWWLSIDLMKHNLHKSSPPLNQLTLTFEKCCCLSILFVGRQITILHNFDTATAIQEKVREI